MFFFPPPSNLCSFLPGESCTNIDPSVLCVTDYGSTRSRMNCITSDSTLRQREQWSDSSTLEQSSATVSVWRRGAGCHHGGGYPGWHADVSGITLTSLTPPCGSESVSWSKSFDSCHSGPRLPPCTRWLHLAWLKKTPWLKWREIKLLSLVFLPASRPSFFPLSARPCVQCHTPAVVWGGGRTAKTANVPFNLCSLEKP